MRGLTHMYANVTSLVSTAHVVAFLHYTKFQAAILLGHILIDVSRYSLDDLEELN